MLLNHLANLLTNFVAVAAVSPVKKVGVYCVVVILLNFHFCSILQGLAAHGVRHGLRGVHDLRVDHFLPRCVNGDLITVLSGFRTRYQVQFDHCHADFGLQMNLRDPGYYDVQPRIQRSYSVDLLEFLGLKAPYL